MLSPVRRRTLTHADGRRLKITFGEMREMGLRGALVFCADYRCGHSVALSADRWADDVMMYACLTLSRGSSAKLVVGAAPTSGRILSCRRWGTAGQ